MRGHGTATERTGQKITSTHSMHAHSPSDERAHGSTNSSSSSKQQQQVVECGEKHTRIIGVYVLIAGTLLYLFQCFGRVSSSIWHVNVSDVLILRPSASVYVQFVCVCFVLYFNLIFRPCHNTLIINSADESVRVRKLMDTVYQRTYDYNFFLLETYTPLPLWTVHPVSRWVIFIYFFLIFSRTWNHRHAVGLVIVRQFDGFSAFERPAVTASKNIKTKRMLCRACALHQLSAPDTKTNLSIIQLCADRLTHNLTRIVRTRQWHKTVRVKCAKKDMHKCLWSIA